MPQVMGPGSLRQALVLGLGQSGIQTLVWKFCARAKSSGCSAPPLPELVNTSSVQHLGHCFGCRLSGGAIQVAVDLRRHRRVLMPEVG
jgi:hypothetical protein